MSGPLQLFEVSCQESRPAAQSTNVFCCSASQAVAENRKAAAANKVNQKVGVSNFQTAATNLVQNLPSGVDHETFQAWLNELGSGHMLFYWNGHFLL